MWRVSLLLSLHMLLVFLSLFLVPAGDCGCSFGWNEVAFTSLVVVVALSPLVGVICFWSL